MNRVSAGKRRTRITIQRQQGVDNGIGGQTTDWVDVATVWAEVIALRGAEAREQMVVRATQQFRVTIRWRADMADGPERRLLLGNRPMNIISCEDPDQRRVSLVIVAEAGVRT